MPKFRLATFFCAFALVGTGLPARADAPDPEVAALRTQITSLTARLDTLEKRAETRAIVAPAPAANVVTNGDFPGSFNLGGSTTSVALHGFISLQSMYDVDQNVGDKFGPAISCRPATSATRPHTRGTFTIGSRVSPSKRGRDECRTATHLFCNRSLRLHQRRFRRPASDSKQLVQLTRASGLRSARPFSRGHDVVQFRRRSRQRGNPRQRGPDTMPVGKASFSFSAENPATDYASSAKPGLNELVSRYNPRPDLTVKYETEQKWGHAQLSAVSRKLGYDDGAGHRSTANGAGLTLGATINLPRHDTIGFNAWTGDGIMKYSPDEFGPVSSAQIANIGTAQQRIVPSLQHGIVLFGGHHFSNQLRSNLGFGFNNQAWQSFIPADASEPVRTRTVHANVIYSPVRQTDLGVEYIHGVKAFRSELKLPDTPATRYEFAAKDRF